MGIRRKRRPGSGMLPSRNELTTLRSERGRSRVAIHRGEMGQPPIGYEFRRALIIRINLYRPTAAIEVSGTSLIPTSPATAMLGP